MNILIADKDPAILELVSTRLSHRGFDVITAETSEEVVRILERLAPKLALISSEMERHRGKHLVEIIREQPHLASIPIVLMTQENEIAQLLMGQERGFDDFLIKPFNPLVLQLRVSINIGRAQVRTEANALTHLPGNAAIERTIRAKIDNRDKFSVLYIDINNFKAFNDRYSFEKGDAVIKQTAKLLAQTKQKISPDKDCFVGHIGGDDFLVVVDPEHEEKFARSFISEFDRLMPTYYSEEDRKRGAIRVKNRRGRRENFPLMSVSVAACNNLYRPYQSLGEIAQDAAEVKSFLKSQPGSHYLRDRRSNPIDEVDQAFDILAPEIPEVLQVEEEPEIVEEQEVSNEAVDPLGRVLLNAGLISEQQLESAIKRHLETGQRLGQTLISMNLVKSRDVGRLLEKKLKVPYVSLQEFQIPRDVTRVFTRDFMRSHRVVPLEIQADMLKLAMCDPFDIRTLDAIERISQMKPSPCLALEDEFEEFIENFDHEELQKEKIG